MPCKTRRPGREAEPSIKLVATVVPVEICKNELLLNGSKFSDNWPTSGGTNDY